MIPLHRPDLLPASLTHSSTLKQAADAENYYSTWKPGLPAFVEFTRYKQDDVKASLFHMSAGKCAYCESYIEKGSFEVEHYRPKGSIANDDAHPGYWWLALDWTNLLPTCPPCNKGLRQHIITADMTLEQVEELLSRPRNDLQGKAMQFPVSHSRLTAPSKDHEAEGPLLIDPTRMDPTPELDWLWHCSYSVVQPTDTERGPSALGAATIECLALNRIDLVVHRTQILDSLRTQRIQIMEALEATAGSGGTHEVIATAIDKAGALIDFMTDSGKPNRIYAGMVQAFIRDLIREFEEWVSNLNRCDSNC